MKLILNYEPKLLLSELIRNFIEYKQPACKNNGQ